MHRRPITPVELVELEGDIQERATIRLVAELVVEVEAEAEFHLGEVGAERIPGDGDPAWLVVGHLAAFRGLMARRIRDDREWRCDD